MFRAKAPLRISFCGGGTDVSPYPEERGGVVLSATIDMYAYASLNPRTDNQLLVNSLDFNLVANYNIDDQLIYNGELDLVKAVFKHFNSTVGTDLFIHSDAPPGSGLGSSSTMTVALVGVFKEWLKKTLSNYDIAELTYQIERVDLKIAGGRQDQYAATFGGFNFIEFHQDANIVNPLRISPDLINELEYHLLLCYTGKTRLSANIVANQTQSYIQKKGEVVSALDTMKELTIQMKNYLLRGQLNEFGNLLHEAWISKKKLDSQISNYTIDELYETARTNGALGGKILGAGGGGYLLLYVPFETKHKISQALEKKGGQVVPFSFEFNGLQTWTAR